MFNRALRVWFDFHQATGFYVRRFKILEKNSRRQTRAEFSVRSFKISNIKFQNFQTRLYQKVDSSKPFFERSDCRPKTRVQNNLRYCVSCFKQSNSHTRKIKYYTVPLSQYKSLLSILYDLNPILKFTSLEPILNQS